MIIDGSGIIHVVRRYPDKMFVGTTACDRFFLMREDTSSKRRDLLFAEDATGRDMTCIGCAMQDGGDGR